MRPNAESTNYFGRYVAISADGNTIAASSTREWSSATGINGDQSDNSAQYSGAVYLFDFDEEIYGEDLEITFVQLIRDEKKFESLEELKAQIAKDETQVRRLEIQV